MEMYKDNFTKNLKLAVKKLKDMNNDDFQSELDKHINGDIANALLETGMLGER